MIKYTPKLYLSSRPPYMTSPYRILAEAKCDQFELAGCGLFAQVVRVVNTGIALKIPDDPGEADAVEKKIYERLGTHPFILQSYGEVSQSLVKVSYFNICPPEHWRRTWS